MQADSLEEYNNLLFNSSKCWKHEHEAERTMNNRTPLIRDIALFDLIKRKLKVIFMFYESSSSWESEID